MHCCSYRSNIYNPYKLAVFEFLGTSEKQVYVVEVFITNYFELTL